MNTSTRFTILLVSLAFTAICVGCGGGGGGGTVTPAETLGLAVTEPALSDKTGETVSVPVTVSGTGTAETASFDLHFSSGVFEPVTGVTVGGESVPVPNTPSTTVARYKWVDAQTIKVLYASSTGVSAGSALVTIPLKVTAETDSALAVQSALINN